MKNLIYLLLLICSTMTAQQDSISKISETERIVDKYSDKILESFEDLVNKVSPMAEDAFEIVVRLQYAKAIGGLLPIFLVIVFIIFWKNVKSKNKWTERGDPDNAYAILSIVLWILVGIFFVISCFTTYDSVLRLMAPEWFAIKEILTLI